MKQVIAYVSTLNRIEEAICRDSSVLDQVQERLGKLSRESGSMQSELNALSELVDLLSDDLNRNAALIGDISTGEYGGTLESGATAPNTCNHIEDLLCQMATIREFQLSALNDIRTGNLKQAEISICEAICMIEEEERQAAA